MKKMVLFLLITSAGAYYAFKPVPPPARERHLAPEGTYYLLSYFSTQTPRGMIGWLPGQEVRVDPTVVSKTGCIAVTDGSYTASVFESLLTRDMDQAEAVLAQDQNAQAQTIAAAEDTKRQLQAQDLASSMSSAARVQAASVEMAASAATGNLRTRLNNGAYGGSYSGGGGSILLYTPTTANGSTAGGAAAGTSGGATGARTSSLGSGANLVNSTFNQPHYSGDHSASRPATGAPARTVTPAKGNSTMSVP